MRRYYNGYFFTDPSYNDRGTGVLPLYNPHLVLHYLSSLKRKGHVTNPEESRAVHSAMVLQSIANTGEFSVDDLMDLVMSGSIKSRINVEFGPQDLIHVGKERAITWSMLYYFGILTRGPNGALKVPNEITKREVLLYYLMAIN